LAQHYDLMNEGPREAPEPETAEERSKKLGLKSAGGVVAGGGVVAAKAGAIGGLGKLFIWLFLWNGVSTAARVGGWVGILLVLAVVVAFVVWRKQRTA
jgi:hypothetical protein